MGKDLNNSGEESERSHVAMGDSTVPAGSALLGGPYDALLMEDDPLLMAVKETQWSVLERFSRVTRAAAHVLDHPLAKPLIPSAIQPYIQKLNVNSATSSNRDEPLDYEPARIYLARWTHEMQVARSKELVLNASSPWSSSTQSNATEASTSSSVTLLSNSMIDQIKLAVPSSSTAAISSSARLAMLYEEAGDGVWDETLQAETSLGTFEVLSTDSTPPPYHSKQQPMSRAEWESYFDYYVPLPIASPPPSMAPLSASIIHISHDDSKSDASSVKLPKGCHGRLKVTAHEIRNRIFLGGIDISIRGEVWRFLFGLYPWDSTHAERLEIKRTKSEEYWRMKAEWLEIAERVGTNDMDSTRLTQTSDEALLRYRDSVMRVDKDIPRTDRGHPFYQVPFNHPPLDPSAERPPGVGAGPPNLNVLRDLLITFTTSYPPLYGIGYVQGMNDLASPLVVSLNADEADAFWCYTSHMEPLTVNFLHSGVGMNAHLTTLAALVKRMDPGLYAHLRRIDCLNLFCCFRWLLVRFKREFAFDNVCRLWEVIRCAGSSSLDEKGRTLAGNSEDFVYFVALAILNEYRDSIIRHLLTFDEALKYINDLSGHIDLDSILAAARILYSRFRIKANSIRIASTVGSAGDEVDEDDDDQYVDAQQDLGSQEGLRIRHSSGNLARTTSSWHGSRLFEILQKMEEAEVKLYVGEALRDGKFMSKKAL